MKMENDSSAQNPNEANMGPMDKARKRRGHKLRRLNDAKRHCTLLDGLHPSEQIALNYGAQKRARVLCKLIAISLVASMSVLYYHGYNASDILSDFVTKYTIQYMSIMHNKINYCERDADMRNLFETLHTQVLHQDVAISELELAFRNLSNVQKIAFVGSSGTGKSLTARLLREQFPWPENVNVYSWNLYTSEYMDKFQPVIYMLKSMSRCGRNLLIIDNMSASDGEAVLIINEFANRYAQTVNEETHKHITIIYIINLNALLPWVQYVEQLDQMQLLHETHVINYRRFGRAELADCIRNEMRIENLIIDDTDVNDIVESIEMAGSGCKIARSKLLVYAKDPPEGPVYV